jgi:hypothetical protein
MRKVRRGKNGIRREKDSLVKSSQPADPKAGGEGIIGAAATPVVSPLLAGDPRTWGQGKGSIRSGPNRRRLLGQLIKLLTQVAQIEVRRRGLVVLDRLRR